MSQHLQPSCTSCRTWALAWQPYHLPHLELSSTPPYPRFCPPPYCLVDTIHSPALPLTPSVPRLSSASAKLQHCSWSFGPQGSPPRSTATPCSFRDRNSSLELWAPDAISQSTSTPAASSPSALLRSCFAFPSRLISSLPQPHAIHFLPPRSRPLPVNGNLTGLQPQSFQLEMPPFSQRQLQKLPHPQHLCIRPVLFSRD